MARVVGVCLIAAALSFHGPATRGSPLRPLQGQSARTTLSPGVSLLVDSSLNPRLLNVRPSA